MMLYAIYIKVFEEQCFSGNIFYPAFFHTCILKQWKRSQIIIHLFPKLNLLFKAALLKIKLSYGKESKYNITVFLFLSYFYLCHVIVISTILETWSVFMSFEQDKSQDTISSFVTSIKFHIF